MSYTQILDMFRSRVQWRSALLRWESMRPFCVYHQKRGIAKLSSDGLSWGVFFLILSISSQIQRTEVLDQVCPGKCFFVTRSGLLGLATAPVEPGQEVWTLMGSAVPIVLHVKRDENAPVKTAGYGFDRSVNMAGSMQAKFDVRRYICQAYIHEFMEYRGNVEDDLSSGKIVAEDVYLNYLGL